MLFRSVCLFYYRYIFIALFCFIFGPFCFGFPGRALLCLALLVISFHYAAFFSLAGLRFALLGFPLHCSALLCRARLPLPTAPPILPMSRSVYLGPHKPSDTQLGLPAARRLSPRNSTEGGGSRPGHPTWSILWPQPCGLLLGGPHCYSSGDGVG